MEEEQKEAASAAVDSSKTSKRKSKSEAPIPLPLELDTPDARIALNEYREHRRQLCWALTLQCSPAGAVMATYRFYLTAQESDAMLRSAVGTIRQHHEIR